jgi:hypothetical protein
MAWLPFNQTPTLSPLIAGAMVHLLKGFWKIWLHGGYSFECPLLPRKIGVFVCLADPMQIWMLLPPHLAQP